LTVTGEEPLPYRDLVRIADRLLERGEDNPEVLSRELAYLAPGIRDELFTSDLLNAYQVFFYFYRKDPGDLERERLMLQPASALGAGVLIAELDLFEIFFSLEQGEPVFSVSDGESVLARYHGPDAYQRALRFLDEAL
jgi:hypothetical protein